MHTKYTPPHRRIKTDIFHTDRNQNHQNHQNHQQPETENKQKDFKEEQEEEQDSDTELESVQTNPKQRMEISNGEQLFQRNDDVYCAPSSCLQKTEPVTESQFLGYCYHCGYKNHSSYYCPLRKCHKCKQYGHLEKVCLTH